MKIKKEYLILVTIIIALSVYLIMRRADRTLYELPEIPKVSQNKITRLEITKGKAVIDLNKKDDRWYIAPKEYRADDDKVKNMLSNIEKFTLTALVSESKNYSLYDLAGEEKINVKAYQEDSLKRDVDVGKAASSFRHTFVKTAGDDRVFHARGNFRNTFDTTIDDLRDKRVLTYSPSDIQQILVTQEKKSFMVKRTQLPEKEETSSDDKNENVSTAAQKDVWQTPDGSTGDDAAVNRLLNRLSNLRCEQFIEDRSKDDFPNPQITVQLNGNQQYSLSIFTKSDEKETEQPATSSASKYAFLLTDSEAENIMKDASSILKEPEAEKEPSAAEKAEQE